MTENNLFLVLNDLELKKVIFTSLANQLELADANWKNAVRSIIKIEENKANERIEKSSLQVKVKK